KTARSDYTLLFDQRPHHRATVARAAECEDGFRQLAQMTREIVDILLRDLIADDRQVFVDEARLRRSIVQSIAERLIGSVVIGTIVDDGAKALCRDGA